MQFSRITILLLFIGLLVTGCNSRKNVVGKWKVISVNVKKNRVLKPPTELVFDADGYIMFNNGKAARGQWEMTPSASSLSIFIYGKALQQDLKIIGTYDFSGDKLTVTDTGDVNKVLLELEKIEVEPTK
jgi:hypothetical protein